MIIRVYLVTLFCCSIFCSKAQQQYNLVPNYSFELYENCPTSYELADALHDKPSYWYKPDKRGARYFNACANGFSNNNNGIPVNLAGGGTIINMPEPEMAMLPCSIIITWTQEIIYRYNY